MSVTWKVGTFHEGGYTLMRMDADSSKPITTVRLATIEEAKGAYKALNEYFKTLGNSLDGSKPRTREEEEEAAWKEHEAKVISLRERGVLK